MRLVPVAALVLLASIAHSSAYSLRPSIGGGYSRTDQWGPAGHASSSTWDLDVQANGSASPFRQGLLGLTGSAGFRTQHSFYSQGTAANYGWHFDLSLAALRASSFPVQITASRSYLDFLSNVGNSGTGATVQTSLGVSTSLSLPGYPMLRMSLRRGLSENFNFGGQRSFAGTTSAEAALHHEFGKTHSFDVDYRTSWNNGTFAVLNHRSHDLGVSALVRGSDGLLLRLNERYSLRLPIVESPTSPRFDSNAFTAGVSRGQFGVNYSYQRALQTTGSTPDLEQSVHTIASGKGFALSRTLQLSVGGSVAFNNQRLGKRSLAGANQSLSAETAWRGTLGTRWQVSAGVGAGIGVSEPSTGGLLGSWGASGNLAATASFGWFRGTANYKISYARASLGLPGWEVTQAGGLSAQVDVLGASLVLSVLGFGTRRDDPLFGTYLARSLSSTLAASWKSLSAVASGGLSEGLASQIANPGIVDGLFLPAPYNTVTRYADLQFSTQFLSGKLVVAIGARTAFSSAPGIPDRIEHGFGITAGFRLGAFSFSLVERYSTGSDNSLRWLAGNVVSLRVSRGFGWVF